MGLEDRIKRLEERTNPAPLDRFPDWPLEDQMEDVLDALEVHRAGGSKQLATDREIHVMGLVEAWVALGDEGGEHTFPSGVRVTVTPDGGNTRFEATGLLGVEDLPEGVREYWKRMDPAEQPERERRLHENWPAAKERRERVRHHFSEEQAQARREESKRRDREVLERNRALAGKANTRGYPG